ncbi:hypothetical protein ACFWA5_43045 [Streptomyces mirabilis]|uniref:LexA family protein n=1 Tax=Streptomyces mirabilis TaxID=68239 RepID=UPI0036468CFF
MQTGHCNPNGSSVRQTARHLDRDVQIDRGSGGTSEVADSPRDRAARSVLRSPENRKSITESVDRQGYPLSTREIGRAVKLANTSSVARQLMDL